ncbi:MAG: hypothetical protein ACR2QT_01335 [Woeseiaceae bacterium]
MSPHAADHADDRAHKIQQAIKWTVYTLLLINFAYYIYEDWNRATYVLTSNSTFLQWAKEFATSIDEAAWFILLAMFELETYILDEKTWKGWVGHAVRATRLLCIVMIAHTIFAFSVAVNDLRPTVPIENATSLCDMVDDDVSYVYNLEYTDVTEQTCADLSTASEFYRVGEDPVVSDLNGLNLERDLAWSDLAEVIIWVIILALIEVVVRLQDRGITGGRLMSFANNSKLFLYLSLVGLGVYWAYLSHWLYLWDELVWILGFAAIEMNVSEWRDELLEVTGNA